MGRDLNKVCLTGRLGKDPELKHLPSGTALCELWMAVSDSKPDSNGGYEDYTHWFNVKVWGKQAESCSQYLGKGSKLAVDGKLEWRSWESDGGKRTAVDVNAQSVIFLDSKADSEARQAANGGGSFVPATNPDDDDIPF